MSEVENFDFLIDALREANVQEALKPDKKDIISEEEALDIYNEVLNVFAKHDVSYRNACNLAISILYALMTGAAELYEFDNE